MKTLVTGAAGFIGSQLSERLVDAGHEVIGIDSFTDYYDPALKRANLTVLDSAGSFTLVEGSLNEVDLEPLVAEAEVVFHLAGQPGVRASWGEEFGIYVDENIRATQRLLEASRDTGLRRLVLASSSSVYGNAEHYPTSERDLPRPVSPYGVTKLAAEHLAGLYWKAHRVPTVALRYFTIFGPRQRPDMAFTRFIAAASKGDPITIYGDGEQIRDFTFVADCITATIAAAERGREGAVYNIAGGTQATVLDVLEILEGLLGRPVERLIEPAVPGDARRTGADTTLAQAELGYEPSTTLAEGIRLQLEAQAS